MVHPSRRRKFVETNDDELSAGQNTLPKRRYTPANLPDFRKVVEEDPSTRRNGRRSRWASRSKSHVPGLPTALPANLAPEQLQSYVLHMRLEEINRKLRLDDVVPSVERRQRSPSPEPVYGSDGKRVNTKEFRYRQVLEAERAKLVDLGQNTIPGFKLQGDFKRGPTKMTEKIFIPDREHPHINFMGLLIGPRGNTLKKMEAETGAKISIRGRGSIKEGKQRGESDNMDLHALISGDSEEKVRKAVKVIENIIDQVCTILCFFVVVPTLIST